MNSLHTLERRLTILLPAPYRDKLESIKPVSMGSASLRFDPNGLVAWDQIWRSFCDLALAGGPPHRGTLLVPGSAAEIAEHTGRYHQVTSELVRGIGLVTGLEASAARTPGRLRVECRSVAMAGWLGRAINVENVSATWHGTTLELPAGPLYRLEKEIKNVITALAKTCHSWVEHTPLAQQLEIGTVLAELDAELPLLSSTGTNSAEVTSLIERTTGLRSIPLPQPGWIGIALEPTTTAVWLMRALVASNVVARREGAVLALPIDSRLDPHGSILADRFSQLQSLTLSSL